MMFSLREFIKRGLIESIGNEPNYKIIQNTAGWLDKGVLQESDVEEISNLLNKQNEDDNEVKN